MARPFRSTLLRWSAAAALIALALVSLPALEREAEDATVAAVLDDVAIALHESLPGPGSAVLGGIELEGFDDAGGALAKGSAQERMGRIPGLELVGGALPGGPESGRSELPEGEGASDRGSPRRELPGPPPEGGEGGEATLGVHLVRDSSGAIMARATLSGVEGGEPIEAIAHRGAIRPWSVLPPLLAIVLSFASGRLILSLLGAIVLGALLSAGPSASGIGSKLVGTYLWEATILDPDKRWIFVFTLALVGLVNLVTRAGGIQGVVDRLVQVAKGPRSAQAVTYLLGLAIFFDDYANTILVGNTMRPLTDRMRISREKLAYLVDSTSAPIAGVAVISTWIGYEVGLLGDLSRTLGLGMDGYALFFEAVPFRFYCAFTLLFVAMLIVSGRDFGPMFTAESRAARTGMLVRPGSQPLSSAAFHSSRAKEGIPRRASVALLPIGAMLLGTLFGLLWDGGGVATILEAPALLFDATTWRESFGGASSTRVLGYTSLGASLLAMILVVGRRLLGVGEALAAWLQGARSMWLALVILTLAWGIKAVCDDLGTSQFLVAGLRGVVHPQAVPLLIFLLAGIVAFATGTSWGTMGILIPTAAPLAFHLGGTEILFLSLAAVLDGAIFGDHISPISDTTVMSSLASGADHLDHVKTQAPYALVTWATAAIFGYGWNALGLGYGLGWILGPGTLAVVIVLLGRNPRLGLGREAIMEPAGSG